MKVGTTTRYYSAYTQLNDGGSYSEQTFTWATNPKTGVAWTRDDVNGSGTNKLAQFGFRAYCFSNSSGYANNEITEVFVTVNYTVPSLGGNAGGAGGCAGGKMSTGFAWGAS